MTKQIAQELDERELLEVLELAKEAEQKAKEMCELVTANTEKWLLRIEERRAEAQRQK